MSTTTASPDRVIPDEPLRRDVRMLGEELGRMLRHHAGEAAFALIEQVRALTKARRAGDAGAEARLRELFASLSLEQLALVIRAMSGFFDLANLAEDRHRVRVLRARERALHPAPRSESIGAAVRSWHEQGLDRAAATERLGRLCVDLVITAHPTEAKRRTVRKTLRRLRSDLIALDRAELLPRERDRVIARIRAKIACLWDTDTLRPNHPGVLEEVRRNLFVARALWDVAPELYRSLRQAIDEVYGDEEGPAVEPDFLRFGSWIGGDRDGNPYVTAEVTRETLAMLRRAAVDAHLRDCRRLVAVLTVSDRRCPVGEELKAALDAATARWPELAERIARYNPQEVYRNWLGAIRFRLERTGAHAPGADPEEGAYRDAAALVRDLRIIDRSLRAQRHEAVADGALRDWIDRARIFGFHLARLDMREDSARLHQVVAELTAAIGVAPDYAARDEAGRQAALLAPFGPEAAGGLDRATLTGDTRETLSLFELLDRTCAHGGADALGMFIVSMTHAPSDALTVRWLARLAAAASGDEFPATLPVVPLFETVDDLGRAHQVLGDLLECPAYRAHVEACGGTQCCMIGYSDSAKRGGVLPATWRLFTAQQRLTEVARGHGIRVVFFHGRGGSLGRGGGPAARGILSLPPGTIDGAIRITEQGEVLSARYDDPEIALRHLEQVTWATMLVSARGPESAAVAWTDLMERASDAAQSAYHALLATPGFIAYFTGATPIDTIESMPIGSRPSRRRGGERRLEDLRAIPFTFAWAQNRHFLNAFYGFGAGLEAATGGDWSHARDMFAEWPFFRALIENVALALARCDMDIAAAYAAIVPDREAGQRIIAMVTEEHARSCAAVRAITGRAELLGDVPWLARSIDVRNPYVDAINFAQIDLVRRRAEGDDREAIDLLLRETVQGIAAGLRATG